MYLQNYEDRHLGVMDCELECGLSANPHKALLMLGRVDSS